MDGTNTHTAHGYRNLETYSAQSSWLYSVTPQGSLHTCISFVTDKFYVGPAWCYNCPYDHVLTGSVKRMPIFIFQLLMAYFSLHSFEVWQETWQTYEQVEIDQKLNSII